MRGWIYVLDDGQGHYKIGRAAKLDKRIKALKIQLPFPVTIAYCCEVDDCVAAERHLHKLFGDRRLNGEWFALDNPDFGPIAAIATGRHFYEEDGQLKEFPSTDFDAEELLEYERNMKAFLEYERQLAEESPILTN